MTLLPDATRSFAHDLDRRGERPALVDAASGTGLSYAGLQVRVDEAAERLGLAPRLVLLEGANTVATVATYLAALQLGHPVLLAPGGRAGSVRRLVEAYDPDVVVSSEAAGIRFADRRRSTTHELHPDLALLLSTSGSTGSAKVVRLSHANLQANADAIALALGIDEDDVALTSLPMAYCYGLSVLHSHLARGASIVLSESSVVDESFWRTLRDHRATTFAGVPHTFELLDRVGFADLHLPTLRSVTQAGGRLESATVVRYAELGRRRGWALHVMYGQTEATARMAVLPPELARTHPRSIGRAIPGGAFELDLAAGDADEGIGELVYRGPNVMLGYASGPADLALGRTVDELRTGDLARVDDDGLYEIVGRRHRFVKPFGLRIDLDGVERELRSRGVEALAAGDDRRLVVATTSTGRDDVASRILEHTGLPAAAVDVHVVPSLPRLDNGKADHAAVLAMRGPLPRARGASVRDLFEEVLRLDAVGDEDSFGSAGGDSLSYVELSVRLEELVGPLPEQWPTMTVAELEQLAEAKAPPRSGRGARVRWVETTVALRAGAAALIVATHAGLTDLRGGAHLLLAIAGWNFARFQLPADGSRLARSVGRILVPTVLWLSLLLVVTDDYGLHNLLLLHSQIGPEPWDPRWRYWFVEALVPILVIAGGLVCIPAVRRLERRRPFAVAAALVGVTLAVALPASGDRIIHRPQTIAWVFALGWLGQRAATNRQRMLVSVASVVGAHLFFVDPEREGVLIAGMLALLWLRAVPVVAPLHRLAALLAGASLWIYLVHWQVYPAVVERATPALATVASLAVGVAAHRLYELRSRTPGPSAERFTDGSADVERLSVGTRHGNAPRGANRQTDAPPNRGVGAT